MAKYRHNPFDKSDWIAEKYARQLRQLGTEIQRIVKSHDPLTISGLEAMQRALDSYTDILKPWAIRTAKNVAEKIDIQDYATWNKRSVDIGRNLKDVIKATPAGEQMRDFVERQVHYITSLPRDAGIRAQALAIEARTGGKRPDEVMKEIYRTGEVTRSRATLIARTEVARAGSVLTQTRAQAIGATHYIWRTSRDKSVRHSHAQMEGVVCELDHAPTLSDGTTTHPGQIYNCRCSMEIIVPDL
ncbi:MAG: minor capsid protein [Syntrophomonadaceae bacterium]|nr:minor capsid protein [Syntrophomonadaceae bacterium]